MTYNFCIILKSELIQNQGVFTSCCFSQIKSEGLSVLKSYGAPILEQKFNIQRQIRRQL